MPISSHPSCRIIVLRYFAFKLPVGRRTPTRLLKCCPHSTLYVGLTVPSPFMTGKHLSRRRQACDRYNAGQHVPDSQLFPPPPQRLRAISWLYVRYESWVSHISSLMRRIKRLSRTPVFPFLVIARPACNDNGAAGFQGYAQQSGSKGKGKHLRLVWVEGRPAHRSVGWKSTQTSLTSRLKGPVPHDPSRVQSFSI